MKKANLDFSIPFSEQTLSLVDLIRLKISYKRLLKPLDSSRSCNAFEVPMIQVSDCTRCSSVPTNTNFWLIALMIRSRESIFTVGLRWSNFLSHIVLCVDHKLEHGQQCQWKFSKIVFGVWKFGSYCWLVDAVLLLLCLIVGVFLYVTSVLRFSVGFVDRCCP